MAIDTKPTALGAVQTPAKQGSIASPKGSPNDRASRGSIGILNTGNVAPLADETSALTSASQALTGKAQTAQQGPQLGRAVEQAAQVAEEQKLKTIYQAVRHQERAIQLDDEAALQQASEQAMAIKEQALNIRQSFTLRTQELLTEMEQQREALDYEKSRVQAEQLGFLMRLQNDKYIYKLRAEAKRSGLLNKVRFQEACMETAFQEQQSLLKSDLEFRSLLKADDRTFQKKLAEMGEDMAWSILLSELSAANTQTRYQAMGSAAQTGIQAASSYAQSRPVQQQPVATGPAGDASTSTAPSTLSATTPKAV